MGLSFTCFILNSSIVRSWTKLEDAPRGFAASPRSVRVCCFCAACEILGLGIGEVRDTSTSSEYKGESREDSMRTFSSYFDCIIMRTQVKGLAERTAWVLSHTERPVPTINAGSGKDQHPTQALLDIYTLQRSFETRGGIDGKTVVFVGDLARGRTVRSLACLLTRYGDVKLWFVAPPQLQIGQDILEMLDQAGTEYEVSSDFEAGVAAADALYMTRVQDEWDSEKGESDRIDTTRYAFTGQHLDILGSQAVIMHPLPRRNEIATEVDNDPRAVYWRQMRNGMWVRVALLADIFRCQNEIDEHVEA